MNFVFSYTSDKNAIHCAWCMEKMSVKAQENHIKSQTVF